MSDAEEQARRVLRDSEEPTDVADERPAEVDLHADRTRETTHTSLSRMRGTDWKGADREAVLFLLAEARSIVDRDLRVADSIMEKIYKYVRIPLSDGDGVIVAYDDGTPRWETDEWGIPVEDWDRLEEKTRRGLLFSITTHLYRWERMGADAWAEAMYAKVRWEEAFARGFISLPPESVAGKPTINDRTQHGYKVSAEDRYFAVFKSAVSKQFDATLKAMNRLQRLLENTTTA